MGTLGWWTVLAGVSRVGQFHPITKVVDLALGDGKWVGGLVGWLVVDDHGGKGGNRLW